METYCGPHHSSSGKRLTIRKSTTVLRVGDHRSGGPMGVLDQSLVRIREPSSLVGSSKLPLPARGGRGAFICNGQRGVVAHLCPFRSCGSHSFVGQRFAKMARAVRVMPRISAPQRLNSPVLTCNNSDPCGKFQRSLSIFLGQSSYG